MQSRTQAGIEHPHAEYTRLMAAFRKAYPEDEFLVTDSTAIVRIDDKKPTDYYPGFCTITATVRRDTGAVTLQLVNPPLNDAVRALAHQMGGRIESRKQMTLLVVGVSSDNPSSVATLARVIRDVPRKPPKGSSFVFWDDNWSWIARRAAKSLERFARCLIPRGRVRSQAAD